MKLPRWLLIGLWTSSVLAVLAAAGWWWVTWPERTACRFLDCLAARNFDEADEMMIPVPRESATVYRPPSELGQREGPRLEWRFEWHRPSLRTKARTWSDVFAARGSFVFPAVPAEARNEARLEVERGRVKFADLDFQAINRGIADHDIVETVRIWLGKNQ